MVTEAVGALNDRYLERPRPLGASRLLWEVGPDGDAVRELRRRLGMDSGYLSRLLRLLEQDGLVVVAANSSDARIRDVHLTDAGMDEWDLLDRGSDDLVGALLAPLTARQREKLISAAGTVERLLTAGMVVIAVEEPSSTRATFAIDSYMSELNERFESGFEPSRSIPATNDDLMEPAGLLLVATLKDQTVGCGALKFHGASPAEVKRMWVSPAVRGLGLGRRILTELENHAFERGVSSLRLETNRSLTEAIALYRSAGYREVERFNDEQYAHHWFEKSLR